MSLDRKFNYVTFESNGIELDLTLETDWVISAGMAPNVNTATVRADEFDALARSAGPSTSFQAGTINFYYSSSDQPDVTISKIIIVDVLPGRIGSTDDNSEVRWLDYRVCFADLRTELIPPRGGVLMDGEVNPEPLPPNATDDDILDNTKLIKKCLVAAGASFTCGNFSAVSPMRKLQWFGARAPDELSKLLQWCGGCCYVNADGSIGVDLIGSGSNAPTIAQEDLIANLTLPSVDRRGKTVVYVSAPTAAQEIYDGDGDDDDSPSFVWVARDSQGDWAKLADNDLLNAGGADPDGDGSTGTDGTSHAVDKAVKNDFADQDEDVRDQLRADVYRCLQLDPDSYDPRYNALLKQIATDDGYLSDLSATATIAQRRLDGTWANTQDDVQLTITHIYGQVNVLRFSDRLAKVDPTPTFDPNRDFKSIDAEDVTISFAMESAGNDGTGKGYFAAGARSYSGAVVPLTSAEATSALQGGGDDIVILHAPAARLRKVNGEDTGANSGELTGICQSMAHRFLNGSDTQFRVIMARGFVPASLSGKVSEIRYSQAEAKTTIKVNTWFSPGEGSRVTGSTASALVTSSARSGGVAAGGSAGGEAYPQQHLTNSDRAAIGASGAVQPVMQVGVAPTPILMRYDCAIKVTGNESGTGLYDCKVADLPLSPDLSAGVVIDFPSTKGLLVNVGETSGGSISGGSGTHIIASETVLLGTRGPVIKGGTADGKTLVWTYFDKNCFRAFQYIDDPQGSGDKLFQGSPIGSMQNPPGRNDTSWVTLLTFEDNCASGGTS